MRILFQWLMLFVLVGACHAQTPYATQAREAALAFEKSVFLQQTLHAKRKNAPRDWKTQSGAIGVNQKWDVDKSLPWFIEEQRLGANYVGAGLAFGELDQIRWGLKMLSWGFANMAPDGEFKHRDNYHSAAFFVEAAAYSLLLLEADPLGPKFSEEIQTIKPRLRLAAQWMMRPDVHIAAWEDPRSRQSQRAYTHRRYLDAAAIGQTGLLLGDAAMISHANALVIAGIAAQRSDGVNPERDGYDSHYQSVGLMFAARYYELVADTALRERMKPMLDKGFAWLVGRIDAEGNINTTGNTRTGTNVSEVTRSGRPKVGFYVELVRALAHWGRQSGREDYVQLARSIYDTAQRP